MNIFLINQMIILGYVDVSGRDGMTHPSALTRVAAGIVYVEFSKDRSIGRDHLILPSRTFFL